MAAAAPKEKVVRALPTLTPNRVKVGEFARNVHIVDLPERTEKEDLTDPNFWASVAQQFRPFDRIEARAEEGHFMTELLVINCGKNWAHVAILQHYDLASGDIQQTMAAEASAYTVAFKGPHHKWSVIRNSDKEYVHSGETQREGADKWLREHLKAFS